MFSQPCYDRGRAQICSTALTRELSTFAKRSRGNLLVLNRAFFVNNVIYMAFLLNSQAQGVSSKNEKSTQTPWRGAKCSCIGCIGLRPSLTCELNYIGKTRQNLITRINGRKFE